MSLRAAEQKVNGKQQTAVLKVILLVLALLLVYWFFWGQRKRDAVDKPPEGNTPVSPEQMVICAHCQLHVPESECVKAAGRHYCCEEHRKLGPP
jgi:uncharacterized protein